MNIAQAKAKARMAAKKREEEIEQEEILVARYAHLELRDTSELRLDQLCTSPGEEMPTSGVAGSSR